MNELNYFVNKNVETEAEYMVKCDFMEKMAYGKEIQDDKKDEWKPKDGPKLSKNISKEAIEIRN